VPGGITIIPHHMWHHPIQLERHAEKEKRLRDASTFAQRLGNENWRLNCLIVKFGLEALQEQLALQLLEIFATGFAEAKLPIRLTPYNVRAVGSDVCFIEPVIDGTPLRVLAFQANFLIFIELQPCLFTTLRNSTTVYH